jgi:hypothetical protein
MSIIVPESMKEYPNVDEIVNMVNELVGMAVKVPIVVGTSYYALPRRQLFFEGIKLMLKYLQPDRVNCYDHYFRGEADQQRIRDLAFFIPQKLALMKNQTQSCDLSTYLITQI